MENSIAIKNNIKTARLAKLKRRRKLWLDVHLYLGLILGAIIAVVGLTGGILVFYNELQEILNAEQFVITPPPEGQRQLHSLDEIIAAADAIKPPNSHVQYVSYPRKPDLAYKMLYVVEPTATSNDRSGYYVFVNPYTAKATGKQFWYFRDGQRYWGIPLVSFIMQLHYCLLLGDTGEFLVGLFSVLFIISVLTGLIVWWPLTGKFKQALTFKLHASSVRFNFDLHKTAGFYTAIVLLVVFFSGTYFNLPKEITDLVTLFSSVTRPDAWEGIPSAGAYSKPSEYLQLSQFQNDAKPISYAQAEAIVQQHYPSGRLWSMRPPRNNHDVYYFKKHDVDEISRFIGIRDIALDQYTGEILKVYDAGTGSAGDVFLDWQWSLHSGFAFGWTGRILVLLSGLACPILFVTGVIRWLQKRKAARHSY